MNDADFSSINLEDLRLVPDWLKQEAPPPSKQYASYDRPTDYPDTNSRRPRQGGGGGPDRRSRPGGRPSDERASRGSRPNDGGRPQHGPRRDLPPHPRESQPMAAAPIRVEFLPDERCMVGIIKQIRTTHLAYPLFSLARMFLQEPARHYLQLSLVPGTVPAGTMLYQLGDEGMVTLNRTLVEAAAFDAMKDRFYKEESLQKDPPKGNFTNVARERTTGTLLGPTNHHGYQPALRALFESRFSRRMSFDEYRRNIEVSNDPALVERWKEEARTVKTISTIEGEPPASFASLVEARTHFRQHHLENALHQGMSFKLHGSVARRLPEPEMMQAIREAHERELRYPAQFVQLLRQGLQNAGLHIFKHRKRIVYVAATRPTPFVGGSGAVAENVSLILATIAEHPLCTRKTLAERVLGKKQRRTGTGKQTEESARTPDADPGVVTSANPPDSGQVTPEVSSGVEPADLALNQTSDPAAIEPSASLPVTSSEGASSTPLLEINPAVEEGSSAATNEVPTAESSQPASSAAEPPADDGARARAALAADIRFLVQAGHIIEFHNGTFDLPLPPKPKDEPQRKPSASKATGREDANESVGSDPAAVGELDDDDTLPAVGSTSSAQRVEEPAPAESHSEPVGTASSSQLSDSEDKPAVVPSLETDAPEPASAEGIQGFRDTETPAVRVSEEQA